MEGRYYWLRLKKDFFKRKDIQVVEAMPNGKDYVLFYLKLLLEGIETEGSLRLSDTIPYNEDMLAVITNTNIDIVRSAMKVFIQMGMVEIMADETIFMNEVQKMLGSETKWAEKKRAFRAKEDNVLALSSKCPNNVRQEIETELDIDIDIKGDKPPVVKAKPSKRFVKPSVEDIKAYCSEHGYKVNASQFFDYYEANGWMIGKSHMKDWKATVRNWNRRDNGNKATSNGGYPDGYWKF